MNIGINIASMTPGASGGHEGYVRNLIRCLSDVDRVNRYVLVTGPMNFKTFTPPGPNWKIYLHEGSENTPLAYFYSDPNSLPTFNNRYVENVRKIYAHVRGFIRSRTTPIWHDDLSRLAEEEQLDIWFCPLIYALPLDIDIPIVNTIPDLQHEHYPTLFDEGEYRFRAVGYQYSCRTATATLAISETTARDLAELYDINANKLFVTPLSVDPSFRVGSNTLMQYSKKVRTKYGLDGDYIYYPANGWPHKNHAELVRALHYCRNEGLKLTLVLTGTPFDLMERISDIVDRYNLRDYVRHLGYVDSRDVVGLYGGAKALVFPSLFEGFGIPLLEAMVLGTPVACSDVTSLPEVGGDAPVYFDPKDSRSIGDSIVRIVCDEGLRARTIHAGIRRAKEFSYERTAKGTLNVFEKIVRGDLDKPHLDRPQGVTSKNAILDGHARWYFHCRRLEDVSLRLIWETRVTIVHDQKVTAYLNNEIVGEFWIKPNQEYQLVITPNNRPPDGFYRLDIHCLNNGAQMETTPIRFICIETKSSAGDSLNLICSGAHSNSQ